MKTVFYLVVLVALTFGSICCSKDDDDEEKIVNPTIQEDIIPQEIVDSLKSHMDINEGCIPPDITGEYVVKPYIKVYDSRTGDSYSSYDPKYMSLTKIKGEDRYSYYIKQGNSTSKGDSLIVIGSGDTFTAYCVEYITYEDTVSYTKRATVFSGIKVDNGIKNLKYTFVILDKIDPKNEIMPIGASRYFIDGDSLSVDSIWTSTTTRSCFFEYSTHNNLSELEK